MIYLTNLFKRYNKKRAYTCKIHEQTASLIINMESRKKNVMAGPLREGEGGKRLAIKGIFFYFFICCPCKRIFYLR